MKFFYVYILQSATDPDHFYTGFTEQLEQRIHEHNEGKCSHTSKYKPWRIKTSVAFTDKIRALDFERYLKTSSGRAFAKKRLKQHKVDELSIFDNREILISRQ